MKSKLWVFRDINPSQRARWPRPSRFLLPPRRCLLARGVTTPDEATTWMSLQTPTRSVSDSRYGAGGRTVASRRHDSGADLLLWRLRCRWDYGNQPLSVVFSSGLGAQVRAYVPHRLREGYGLNLGAVQRLHDEGISLLVTSDCGTTSHHEIACGSPARHGCGGDGPSPDRRGRCRRLWRCSIPIEPTPVIPFVGSVPRRWPIRWRRRTSCATERWRAVGVVARSRGVGDGRRRRPIAR